MSVEGGAVDVGGAVDTGVSVDWPHEMVKTSIRIKTPNLIKLLMGLPLDARYY